MLITAIEPRRKAMAALYIDGEFVMNLDAQTLLENRFDVGREIDDEDLREIIRLSNERRAKEKALWLISYRDHSKKELKEKIQRTWVLDEIEVDPREQIRAVLAKKYRSLEDEKTKRRAVAALQRLGYGWDDIKAVLSEYET